MALPVEQLPQFPKRRDSAGTAGSSPRWPLRTALLVALAVLVAGSLLVATMRPAPRAIEAPTSTARSTTPSSTTLAPSTTLPPSTATTVHGAVSSPTTVAPVGHGCNLALGHTTAAVPRDVGRCTVLEIGDSLGEDLGIGLSQVLAPSSGLNLVMLDKDATGLANSWYYDWPVHLVADLTRYRPQLVIVMLGGNDQQGMVVNGRALAFGTAAWKTAYLSEIHTIIADARSAGAYVLWVGLPIMQSVSYSNGCALIDSLDRQAATEAAGATFIPTWSLFSNPDGQFESTAAVNGIETTLRASDGIHFSPSGWDVLATAVVRTMAPIYHVRLVPASPSVITHWG